MEKITAESSAWSALENSPAENDPDSFSHRYAVYTKRWLIELTHENVDLAALADVMNAGDGFFSGCDGYLGASQSAGPLGEYP